MTPSGWAVAGTPTISEIRSTSTPRVFAPSSAALAVTQKEPHKAKQEMNRIGVEARIRIGKRYPDGNESSQRTTSQTRLPGSAAKDHSRTESSGVAPPFHTPEDS